MLTQLGTRNVDHTSLGNYDLGLDPYPGTHRLSTDNPYLRISRSVPMVHLEAAWMTAEDVKKA
jgi:hypothetical protein